MPDSRTSWLIIMMLWTVACTPAPRYTSHTRGSKPGEKTMTGVASYYGKGFHGKKTANGEVFDMNDLTAAHKTLPFGTTLRVTNLDNNRTVEVRINDRGPFVKNRIIDLSYGAAKRIDMIGTGTARVKLDVLNSPASK